MTVYKKATYHTSAARLDQLPGDKGREVAFVGRSNAGKSSVINALTGRRRLARISKTPGRTQTINFFTIDADRRLVDLPGYGYARVPGALQAQWSKTLGPYLQQRQSLVGVVMIVDIRRLLGDHDQQMLDYCHSAGVPVHILLNKSDKLSFSARQKALRAVLDGFPADNTAGVQLFCATARSGVDELEAVLDSWFAG